jgi:hypothetical protein
VAVLEDENGKVNVKVRLGGQMQKRAEKHEGEWESSGIRESLSKSM